MRKVDLSRAAQVNDHITAGMKTTYTVHPNPSQPTVLTGRSPYLLEYHTCVWLDESCTINLSLNHKKRVTITKSLQFSSVGTATVDAWLKSFVIKLMERWALLTMFRLFPFRHPRWRPWTLC